MSNRSKSEGEGADGGQAAREVERLITSRLSQMPSQLRRLARHVLAHADEVPFLTARELAMAAGTSPATVVRLARYVGFEGYRDLRRAFRTFAPPAPPASRQSTVPGRELLAGFPVIDRRKEDVFVEAVDRASDAILAAETVFAVGFRSAHPFAQYLVYLGRMAMPKFRLANQTMSGAADHLAIAGPRDLVIVYSVAPYSTEAVQLGRYLNANNIPSVAVTDNASSPLGVACDHVLEITRARVGRIHSMAACLTASEVLLAACYSKLGVDADRQISAFEDRVRKMSGYWSG
ncbi:MurR/RpiR family transcriptional regulator [Cucumibacter marinus]|uniref:MurR/RpiR family transcriptional regulator n=1 Tax=Cucumibacter marinus TaxID=1121252 RepID=UPI00041E3BB5|nr:MurR/RpiR family transcriptional regulator [Cucumibacter marinus]